MKRLERWVSVYFTISLALPLNDDTVPLGEQEIFLGSGGLVHLSKRTVWMEFGVELAVGVTACTPMPQTAVEFVDGTNQLVITVDVDRLDRCKHPHFPAITRMTYAASRKLAARGSRGVDA